MIGKRLVFRTWGWYLTLLDRKHFKVKLLRFRAASRMSRQYHNLRNELWLFLNTGEFREIPARKLHTYRPRKTTYVLEIQYGEKCDEEDIVRI